MGWFRSVRDHEGYVVGLVEEEMVFTGPDSRTVRSKYLRELSYHLDHDREVPKDGLHVAAIQVGCECGWRSRRFEAPRSAVWYPYSLDLCDDGVAAAARRLWDEHYDAVTKVKLRDSHRL